MSQQINLLNPELMTVKHWLDARMMLLLAGFAAMLMLAAYGWTRHQVTQLKQAQLVSAGELALVKEQLSRSMLQHEPRAPSKTLEEQVKLAEAALSRRQQVLEFLQGGGYGNAQGFSPYMQAFAHQSVKGLWLTGFAVDDALSQIRITGRTLQPELVPVYISALGQEPALKGREFSALSMDLIEQPAPTAVASADGKKPVSLAAVVEFKLQSLDKASPAVQAAATVEKKP
jgi:hypothetical protein